MNFQERNPKEQTTHMAEINISFYSHKALKNIKYLSFVLLS